MPDVTAFDPTLRKDTWGQGLWLIEPDIVSLIDGTTGYPILLNRHPTGGFWCGYVGVPATHAAHGETDVRRIPVGAPGGVTYAGPNAAGTGADWWIGFTAGSPAGAQPGLGITGIYVTQAAIRAQAIQLALDLQRIQPLQALPAVLATSVPTTPTVPTTSTSTTAAGVTVSAGTTSSSVTASAGTGVTASVPTTTVSAATPVATASASTASAGTVTGAGTTVKLGS